MDEKFTVEQWQSADALAVKIISEVRISARIATEVLRMWNRTQILDKMQRDINKAFSIRNKHR